MISINKLIVQIVIYLCVIYIIFTVDFSIFLGRKHSLLSVNSSNIESTAILLLISVQSKDPNNALLRSHQE